MLSCDHRCRYRLIRIATDWRGMQLRTMKGEACYTEGHVEAHLWDLLPWPQYRKQKKAIWRRILYSVMWCHLVWYIITTVSQKPTTWIFIKEERVICKKKTWQIARSENYIWFSLLVGALTVHVIKTKLSIKPTFLGHTDFLVHNKTAGYN